jgi:hypothetical protein
MRTGKEYLPVALGRRMLLSAVAGISLLVTGCGGGSIPVTTSTGGTQPAALTSLAVASPQAREEAKRAVAGLRTANGTAIGQWLRLAHQMFSAHPAELRHVILLTDGQNQHETPEQLGEAIALCEGMFGCDCRGVGTDWEVSELRRISSALLGTVDIVPDPAGLAAGFTAMMETAMGKQVAGVALCVWTPQHATVRFLKQVAPAVEDLTARRTASGAQAGDYPTGAWGGGESRDYHLCVQVTPAAVGQEMLAARVSLVSGPPTAPVVLGQGLVRAIWTDDEALSTRINAHIAHYTGQAELAQAIHAATGTVRLRKRVDDADEMALDTRSTKTVRTRK